jgi:D-aspartate ligase
MSSNNINGVIVIEGHVQGLSNTRAIGIHNIPVWVVDNKNCIARRSKYCSRFLICPNYNSTEFIDFLIQTAEENQLENWLLLPSNDHAVYNISKNRKTLLNHFKLIVPELKILENIYDKSKLLEIAKRIKIPIPQTYVITDLKAKVLNEIKFPVLTKGKNGLTFYKKIKKKVLVANDLNTLKNQLKSIQKVMPLEKVFTQNIIPDNGSNKTISFTSFSIDGEIKTFWMGTKLREHPIKFGTATFVESIYIEELIGQSTLLLSELNYTGICEIEYIMDPIDEKYKLIEINPRTWLWVGLANACGINYAKMAYDYVHQKPIDYPKKYEIGLFWYNPFTDWIFSVKAILKNKLTIKEYLKTVFKNKENALFVRGDLKPGLFYLFNIFNFLRNR